ncbi:MAG: tetratricopeptide repeat protein [Treponema sp.]|nr:tetratricopeptide repeat protein [Treponema sp.]
MAEKFNQEETTAGKIDSFLTRNRSLLLTVALVVLVAIIAVAAFVVITGKSAEKGLSQVDAIYYTLTKDADSLEGDALLARQDSALEQLATLTKKGGIVGARANMLAADLQFQKKDFEAAKASYLKVASAKKNAYTAPLAYFNAAACAENLNDLDGALEYYTKASVSEDFLLADHALFSIGRVNEAKSDFKAAQDAYNKLNDVRPDGDWAELAKSRLIELKANGSIE